MATFPTENFASFDGTRIAYRTIGAGRDVVLIHGLFSNADTNWVRYGTAKTIADAGFRLILPDLRAHGGSDSPREAAGYPDDVLARDNEALVAHLGLTDYDLGGYSLGGRTTVRMLVRGATPRRVVLGGMGLQGITGGNKRRDFFLKAVRERDTAPRGSAEWSAANFMKQMKVDPEAATHLLEAFADSSEDEVRGITQPALVVCGKSDDDNGSAADLVAALPHGTLALVPGNHMSAVTAPEFGAAIRDYLSA